MSESMSSSVSRASSCGVDSAVAGDVRGTEEDGGGMSAAESSRGAATDADMVCSQNW